MDMVTKKPDVAPTEVTPKAKRRTYSPRDAQLAARRLARRP